jgi:hypothetical protein
MPQTFGASEFNAYQSNALQSYGSGQAAVDYILAQRYGAAPEPGAKEGFGMAADPLAWENLPGRTGFDKLASYAELDSKMKQQTHGKPRSPSLLELRYRGL